MTDKQKYEAVPVNEWFKKGLSKEQNGKTAKVYYYMLACSKPNYDKNGRLIDMRTSEKDTGKVSELCNKQKQKNTPARKGVLNIDPRTYNNAINTLVNGTEVLVEKDDIKFAIKIPPLLEPVHNEFNNLKDLKGKGSTKIKSKAQTEFIIKDFHNTPGFQFSKIDKDLLKVLSTFENPYVISVLASLLWQNSAAQNNNKQGIKYIPPTFCTKFLCQGFGMENPSHQQWQYVREAVLLLEGMHVIETSKFSVGINTFKKLLKINNRVEKGVELDEKEILARINMDTREMEYFSKTPDADNNIKPINDLLQEINSNDDFFDF